MKNLNIYFDCEFTSLSPDAQLISIGMVTDEIMVNEAVLQDQLQRGEIQLSDFLNKVRSGGHKSFYAEFTDFDINRCDDWVKENVVGKLKFWNDPEFIGFKKDYNWKYGLPVKGVDWSSTENFGTQKGIRENLFNWLSQFSGYHIQFVADCSTWDWYHLLQLLAEWTETQTNETYNRESDGKVCDRYRKIGLPRIPANASPVPFDLNDLIAIKKGITPAEAFDMNRDEMLSQLDLTEIYYGSTDVKTAMDDGATNKDFADRDKHNALWDAKVIKAIYNKLR